VRDTSVIEAHDLSLTFDTNDGPVHALKDVNLTIEKGDFVSFIGPSGCGKTTLLRVIADLEQPSDGSLTVNGMTPEAARRARAYGYVFQAAGLYPWRSIARNVKLPLEIMGMDKPEQDRRAAEVLSLVDLEGFEAKFPWQLSGGMQQRVGLARAFATDAPILLMDEPCSALDPLIRNHLQDELLDLQASLGRTIIFVSHDLDEAFKLGRRIAIMEGGRIVQCGTPQEIFTNPATEYVAEFVAHMNPLGVLCARDVMEPAIGTPDITVSPDATIQAVMEKIQSHDTPLGVAENGEILGQITRDRILAKLLDPRG